MKFVSIACAFAVILSIPATLLAVEEFKVSEYGEGHQLWFEAEAFEGRSLNENYKLGDAEEAVPVADGAFGDIVTNTGAGGTGWLMYHFDISRAGGEAGTWHFWGRVINSSNRSDWMWMLGDDGDEIPDATPTFDTDDDIIFEEDDPVWGWRGDTFVGDGGHAKELQDGENTMMIWTRQSNLQNQYDVFMWTDDPNYKPIDEDYTNAIPKAGLAVTSLEKLPTLWGKIKSE